MRERLELEAAQILAARIAEGRPPEAEWVAAAQRRARRGPQTGGWYTSTHPAPPPSAPPSPLTRPQHAPLVLRVVRLPVRRRAAAPLR
ncbi:MAG TPA: hypothetical protein VG078_01595 [Acidimicrobiales bacterium]|nr:hypothetical protein [Acidimicrobiales bacterium]